jgi:hypothetical protein
MQTKHISIISTFIFLSSLIFGIFFYTSRKPQNTIRVTGYASKRFESDIVKWTLSITRSTGLSELKNGYQLLKRDLDTLIAGLKNKGINENEITIQSPTSQQQWNRDGQVFGYTIRQNLFVVTSNIDIVEKLARNPDFIYDKGIVLESSYLEYNYTKVGDLKKELLSEATKDAKSRALEIARSSGVKLGKISTARQGVFQITEPNSTDVSDYGIYSTATKQKDITVTVTVTFLIK